MMSPVQAVDRAAGAVASTLGLSRRSVLRPRGRARRRARHLAFYLAVVSFGVPAIRVARAVRIDHRAVSRAVARIEGDRDDPAFDEQLSRLEGELCS